MTDNNDPVKQETIRDEQGRFVEGVSGNPNGRPKKGLTLTDIAKEILEEELPDGKTRKEVLMRKIATLAYEGNETMIKLLWNYIDGMPTQKQEITGNNGEQLAVKIIKDTTLEDANRPKDNSGTQDTELPSTTEDIPEPN